jgi:hypothetical protein
MQNRAAGVTTDPHPGHDRGCAVPQDGQNRAPGGISSAQDVQFMTLLRKTRKVGDGPTPPMPGPMVSEINDLLHVDS